MARRSAIGAEAVVFDRPQLDRLPFVQRTLATLPRKLESASFADYLDLVAPLALKPRAYAGRLHYLRDGRRGAQWPVLPRDTNPTRATLAHLTGGATGEHQSIGEVDIEALGIRPSAGDPTRFVSLDLDGGLDPRSVLEAVKPFIGRPHLVTSSSERGLNEGRFRAYWHVRPVTVDRGAAIVRAVLERAKTPEAPGKVEVYPAADQNSRLPFGAGGCHSFGPSLKRGERLHPFELTRRLLDRKPLDLDWLQKKKRLRAAPTVSQGDKPTPAQQRIGNPLGGRETLADIEALEYLRNGVPAGRRDDAIFAIASDCWRRGLPEYRAVAVLVDALQRGAFDACGDIRSRGRGWQIGRLPAHVARIYKGRAATMRRMKPANLTRSEVASLVAHVRQLAPDDERDQARLLKVAVFGLRLLKASKLAGHPGREIHSADWQAAGGRHYARLRKRLGIFVEAPLPSGAPYPKARYISRKLALELKVDPRCIRWQARFDFDDSSPRDSLIPLRSSPLAQLTRASAIADRYTGATTRVLGPKTGVKAPIVHNTSTLRDAEAGVAVVVPVGASAVVVPVVEAVDGGSGSCYSGRDGPPSGDRRRGVPRVRRARPDNADADLRAPPRRSDG